MERHQTGVRGTTVRLPDGVSFFSVKKAGLMRLEIIPYRIPEGAGNPCFDDGSMGFERTFFIHRGVGANNDSYVCPAKTKGKACPICESRAKLASDPSTDDELLKALLPKERQLWNVYDHDDADKGVQVWDVSFHLFGKQLDARIKNADEDDDYEYFSDPEEGSTLKVGFSEESFNSQKFFSTESIDFKPRKGPVPAAIVEAACVLDDLLITESYEKLKAIYYQLEEVPDEDDNEREGTPQSQPTKTKTRPPKKTSKPPTASDYGIEKGSDVSHEEFGACTVIKISPDGTSLTLIDELGDVYKAIAPDEVTLLKDAPEEEEKPAKPSKPAKPAKPKKEEAKPEEPVAEEEEDDGDWDDGWDENWDDAED